MTTTPRILVIDDNKIFDFECVYARTLNIGMQYLFQEEGWDEVWLDHDLGGDATIIPLTKFLEEQAMMYGRHWPIKKFVVCTNNSPGRKEMLAALTNTRYEVEVYYP